FTGTNKQNLRFNYNGRTGQPSISQLQPIQTTSDSINFNIGNPALKQQFTHSVRMLYSNFNVATQRVMFATINASMISNDIQNRISNIGYTQSQTLVTNQYTNKPSVTHSSYARNTTLGETISWTTNLKDN